MDRIEILDTTLRDGLQGGGINYSLEDKILIVNLLADLGIHLIEGGMPAANPLDNKLFSSVYHDKLVAFGGTMRKENTAETDENLHVLINQKAAKIAIYGKASVYQATKVLGVTPERNLEMISDSVRYLKDNGKSVIFDAEHFYDGYLHNKDYAIAAISAATDAGAETIVLCDTNGGTISEDIFRITREVRDIMPRKITIGTHCHNDCGLAVANTMAAVRAGARHVQGTLLGFGERCGNACLSTIIPNLEIKGGYEIEGIKLAKLTEICRSIAQITNIPLNPDLPYVGENAFAHKAGAHVDAVIKWQDSFEHVSPDAVGNARRLMVSLLSGRANLIDKVRNLFPDMELDDKIPELLNNLKRLESEGYTYDGAEASLYIMCKKLLGVWREYFSLISYKVMTDQTGNNSAIIKISAKGQDSLNCGEGLGPVHALDKGMRGALSAFYPILNNAWLVDYKVRVIDAESATGAKVRVLITSSDGKRSWTTVSVSPDIIQASYNALAESFNYYLDMQENK